MKYERFEDLPVWQAAVELAVKVFALTDGRAFGGDGDLRDQMRRAALSISNNVAEGFERGTTAELLYFLYIARGSAGEVRSMLRFSERRSEGANLKSQISDLKSQTPNLKSQILDLKSQISDLISLSESCSRQLRGWADSLQNTDIKGQKHLTEQSRTVYESKRRAETFLKSIDEVVRRRVEQSMPARGDAAPGSSLVSPSATENT